MRGEDSSFVHVSNDNTDGAKGLYKSCGLGSAVRAWDQVYSETARTGNLEQAGAF